MTEANLTAKYIRHPSEPTPNRVTEFVRDITLENVPDSACAIISAETRYHLWINGRMVVRDGGLFRESRPGCGWADSVELAPHLRAGKNRIYILLHYYGNGGRNNKRLSTDGLAFDCAAIGVSSDSGFLCRLHPAYFTPGEPRPSYLYGGDNLGYDANLDDSPIDPNIPLPDGFVEPATADAEIFGKSYMRPIPLFRFSDEIELSDLEYSGESTDDRTVSPDRTCTAALPWAAWLYPVLYIDADGGERVSVRTDRYEVPGGPGDSSNTYRGHRLEFIMKPGKNRVEGMIALFGEKLIITADRPIKIERVCMRETGYDTDIVDDYDFGDELLNRLVKKAARTLYVCMRDNFMDCPDRERGQWIGDVSVQIPQAAHLLDKRAMLLAKKAILDFVNLRRGDVLVGNVPGEHSAELPAQSLAAISEWGLAAQYLRYTDDLETLSELYLPAVNYLRLWETDERGLVVCRKGNWQWYDHLYNCDGEVIENAWYLSALKFVRRLAELLGKSCEEFISKRIDSISAGIEREYWKGKFYSSDGRLVDDRANALCVLAGVCPTERYPMIKMVLMSVYNCSIYMENFVLTALCEMGYLDEAKRRMYTRYYNLAMNENSTLWEDFNILGTRNHAWSGAPANLACGYAPAGNCQS